MADLIPSTNIQMVIDEDFFRNLDGYQEPTEAEPETEKGAQLPGISPLNPMGIRLPWLQPGKSKE